MSDQSAASSLVFFSMVPRNSGVKSLTVPSYRLPSARSKWRARNGALISSTCTYNPRSFPFTDTVAKLQRGAGLPVAAKIRYDRQVLTIEGSWTLLFRVIRSMTPPRDWPSTYLSKRSLRAGLVSLWEPTKPFFRTPTSLWVSPSTVTVAPNQV